MKKRSIVELPWLASKMDVLLCYAFLKAIKKVHRAVHVIDEEDKSVKLTEDEAKEQWHLRRSNMDEIINRGEKTVIAGVMRDFHLNPALYIGRDEIANRIEDAFADFITVQWTNLEAVNIREERRHITEEEELSTIRVIDNTEDVFIGVCQYVGMMKGNTCKMVKFEDFCHLMEKQDEFHAKFSGVMLYMTPALSITQGRTLCAYAELPEGYVPQAPHTHVHTHAMPEKVSKEETVEKTKTAKKK